MPDERRRKLQEACEDAEMALLMDEYMEAEGEAILKEYEKAREAGEVPEPSRELDEACMALIKNYRKPAPPKEKGPRRHPVLWRVAAAAAVIVLTFATLFTVQANGVDVFGVLARWTENTFGFGAAEETAAGSEAGEKREKNEVQGALERMGLPAGLAPTWVPNGYFINCVTFVETELFSGITADYTNRFDACISIQVLKYSDPAAVEDMQIEKDPGDAETFTLNGHTFYLFTRAGMWSAAWSDSQYFVLFDGVSKREDLIEMIMSMEGLLYE